MVYIRRASTYEPLDDETLISLRAKIDRTRAESEAQLELIREQSRLQHIQNQAAERDTHADAETVRAWATRHYGYTPEQCARRLHEAVREIASYQNYTANGSARKVAA